jgi:DNA-binding winged helix-turn-helix (wHTH) protein
MHVTPKEAKLLNYLLLVINELVRRGELLNEANNE